MSAEQLVLIVSPDPKERRVLEVSLKKAALGARVATDGHEALRLLDEDEGRIAVAVIELNMPRLDGFELGERIRENSRYDSVALIAVTGSRDLATKLRAFEAGYDDLLAKPLFVNEVATRVSLLMQRRSHDALAEAEAEEIEGSLAEVSVIDLLQTIEDRSRTGVARLLGPGGQAGAIYFVGGEVIDADAGRMKGEQAVERLLRWSDGTYAVKYLDRVSRRRRIGGTSSDLLSRGLERLQAWNELTSGLPGLDEVYEVDFDEMVGELARMPEEVRGMLRLFDGLRTLEQVIHDAPVGDVEALRVVERLMRHGYLAPTESPLATTDEDDAEVSAREGAVRSWLGDEAAPAPPAKPRAAASARAPEPAQPAPRQTHEALAQALRKTAPERERRTSDDALRLVKEAKRREEERTQIEEERKRLREEQSSILAALAKSEAEAARAQDVQARRDVEERRRRAEAAPAPKPAERPSPWPAGNGGASPLDDLFDDFELPSPGAPVDVHEEERRLAEASRRDRDEVAAALAAAEAQAALPAASEPAPIDPRKAAEQAWLDAVREKERHYEVIQTATTLKPMTLIPPEPEETSPGGRRVFDMARLAVSDVFDAVPGAGPSIDVDMGFESGPQRTPLGPHATSATDITPPSMPSVADEAPSVPMADDAPSTRTERVSGSFDDGFFRSEPELQGARPKQSSNKAVVLLAIALAALVIAVSVVLVQRQQETPVPEEPVRGAPAETKPGPDKGEPADPFDEPSETAPPVDEPLISPEVIDTEYKANDAAENVIKRGAALAEALAGKVADTQLAQPDELDEELPMADEHPPPTEVKPAEVKPAETKPAETKPAEVKPAEVKPKETKPAEVKPKETKPTRTAEVKPKVEEKPKSEPKDEEKPKSEPKVEEKPKSEPKIAITETSGGGDAGSLVKAGRKAYDKRKYDDAIKQLEAAVEKSPNDTEANYYLGLSYAKAGQAPRALKHLEKVRGSKGGDANYWKELGTVYIRLKKDSQGLEAYKKAIEILGPDNADAKKLQKYLDSRQ